MRPDGHLCKDPFKHVLGLMGMTSEGASPHTGEQLTTWEELKHVPQGLDTALVETGGDKALVVSTLGTALPVALEADGSLGKAFFTPGQQPSSLLCRDTLCFTSGRTHCWTGAAI